MGNKLPKEDCKFLLKNTDFNKADIITFYKDFMKCNPDGLMNLEEFKDFLQGFYSTQCNELAVHYFRAADKDKSGKIDFKEFLLFLNYENTSKPEDRLYWMFDLFDIDGNGKIDKTELVKIYKIVFKLKSDQGDDVSSPEEIADQMLEYCDKNHDNLITREEFVKTFMEDPFLLSIFCPD